MWRWRRHKRIYGADESKGADTEAQQNGQIAVVHYEEIRGGIGDGGGCRGKEEERKPIYVSKGRGVEEQRHM